jgi:hypothetical protein
VKAEGSATGQDLMQELNAFWGCVHEYELQSLSEKVGKLIVEFLESRDPTLRASHVSLPYLESVTWADDDTAVELRDLLISQVDQQIGDLQNMRRQQLQNLATPVSPDPASAGRYAKASTDLVNELEAQALDLIRALGQSRQAEFVKTKKFAQMDFIEEEEAPQDQVFEQ